MKIVSQLNEQGFLIGAVVADESPLEPGVYLLPAGSVDVPPPVVPAGKAAHFDGVAFVLVDAPAPAQGAAPETPPALTPGQQIDKQKQAVRLVREQVLNRLSGIAGRAARKGDTVLVIACDAASEALLDITKDLPATPEQVAVELVLRYQAIRQTAVDVAPSLEAAFAQVDA